MSSARFQRPRRRNLDETTTPKTPRMTASQQNCSAYRLSRVPEKFNQSKALEQDKPQSIIEQYYKTHPNEPIDMRTPDEKYEEIQELLENEDLTEEEKLPLYIREKMLNCIKYGENSVESFRSYLNIGICYNRTQRFTSAIRNLERAHQIEDFCEPLPYERLLVAVETAEAHLELYSTSYQSGKDGEANKHLKQAEAVIDPARDSEVEDPELRYRKDLALAHIYNIKKQYREAMPFFDSGVSGYEESYDDIDDDLAKLCVQAAHNAECIGKNDKDAADAAYYYYKKAYDLYIELEMPEEAEKIKPKLERAENNQYEEEENYSQNYSQNGSQNSLQNGSKQNSEQASQPNEEEAEEEEGRDAYETYQTQDEKSYQYRDPENDKEDDNDKEDEQLRERFAPISSDAASQETEQVEHEMPAEEVEERIELLEKQRESKETLELEELNENDKAYENFDNEFDSQGHVIRHKRITAQPSREEIDLSISNNLTKRFKML